MKRTIFTKEIGGMSFVYTILLFYGLCCLFSPDWRLVGGIVTGISILLITVRVLSWTEVS